MSIKKEEYAPPTRETVELKLDTQLPSTEMMHVKREVCGQTAECTL